MLHVLVGATNEIDQVTKAAKLQKSILWRVPKTARRNEEILFYFPQQGFVARAKVASAPKTSGPRRYSAQMQDIRLLQPPVPLSFIRNNHSKWKWIEQREKSYTTIDGPIEARLNTLLDQFSGKDFTAAQVKDALLAIRDGITEQQMSMLRAHYYYRTLSMERIAVLGGYNDFRTANLQYGKLCGRIAVQLGFDWPTKTFTIATLGERDAKGHFQWRMDDVVFEALKELRWFRPLSEDAPDGRDKIMQHEDVAETERESLDKARIGQGRFRKDLIAVWGGCSITGCNLESILVASHILPWKDATNSQRIDPFNGLLLTPNFDRLFDQFLISFNDDGSIILSKDLKKEMTATLGVNESSTLRFVPPALLPYLKEHRKSFLKKEKTRKRC